MKKRAGRPNWRKKNWEIGENRKSLLSFHYRFFILTETGIGRVDSRKIRAVYNFIMNGIGRVKEDVLFSLSYSVSINRVGEIKLLMYKCKSEMDRST